MTDINKRLAEEYIVDYNITNAAERAGIQGENKRIIAWQMLQLPDVEAYIELLRSEQSQRTFVTADKVQNEIARLAFSDIRDYYHENGKLKLPHELSHDAAAALAGIDIDELWDYNPIKDIREIVGETKKIKLYDKLNALDKLARRLGMFEKDNDQRNTIVQLLSNNPLNDTTSNDSTSQNIGA